MLMVNHDSHDIQLPDDLSYRDTGNLKTYC